MRSKRTRGRDNNNDNNSNNKDVDNSKGVGNDMVAVVGKENLAVWSNNAAIDNDNYKDDDNDNYDDNYDDNDDGDDDNKNKKRTRTSLFTKEMDEYLKLEQLLTRALDSKTSDMHPVRSIRDGDMYDNGDDHDNGNDDNDNDYDNDKDNDNNGDMDASMIAKRCRLEIQRFEELMMMCKSMN